ncbi:MAG TPA: cytochrome c biogenesis protein ResB [Verrucomicrobiae bacterium]|nr:cytochrome c biogenesis protein ResB [Verrucomicrobiae bacterium]
MANNPILKAFGSLKLAVFLLTTLAVVLAGATFYEADTSSKAALLNVYRTWWFNGLLALLAVNLTASALTRWPWKRRHVGFVITHLGIIVILGGCSAAFHYGTEGMLSLHVGQPPSSSVRLDDEAITVVEPATGQRVKSVVRVRSNGAIKPHELRLGSNLRLTLDEFLPNTRIEHEVTAGGTEPNPALKFRLQSELAQQNVSGWLVASLPEQSRASLGPANVQFVVLGDESQVAAFTNVAGDSASAKPQLQIVVGGKSFTFDVASNLEKHLTLGDTGLGAHVMGYWPDFQLDENHKPTSVSDDPNNPAAVVIVSRGDEDEQRHFVFADPQMPPIVRATRGKPIDVDVRLVAAGKRSTPTGLTVALGPDQKLYYAASSKNAFKSGTLEPGKAVEPGWMDFQFTAERFVANAIVSDRIEPAPVDPEGGVPAMRVTVYSGDARGSTWARFGEPAFIEIGGKVVHVMYSPDAMQVPFTVTLENFEVQHDEGSDNVSGWTSHVIFEDAERGITQRAAIWMNHPAWFEGYKFSQASWNPNDLQFTVLQVKKDPQFVTWLTWAGAVLIVSGVALMFWFRRWFQGKGEDGEVKTQSRTKKEMVTA